MCGLVIVSISAATLLTVEVPPEAPELTGEIYALTRDRLLGTVAVGACLGVAGFLLRTASANPLADPEITGVNSGAAFGAVCATALTGAAGAVALLPGALVGACAGAAITIGFGMRGRTSGSSAVSIQRMVLLGIAVSALFSAATSVLLVYEEAQLTDVLAWLSGRLAGVRLSDLIPVFVAMVLVLPVAVFGGRGLDMLSIDDSVAAGTGVSPRTVRLLAVVAAVILIAPAVAATGPIGFLGLMAAAATHRVCGARHRVALPVAALVGASVLLIADSVGQMIWAPAETPVGIVTALVGVPVLLWGINRTRAKRRATGRATGRARWQRPRRKENTVTEPA